MKTINEPKKNFTQTAKNFFCQANEAEKFVKFRHQHLIELAKQYGATFKHFTPDSCDMVFPNKDSMEAFEKARDEYTEQQIKKEKLDGFC